MSSSSLSTPWPDARKLWDALSYVLSPFGTRMPSSTLTRKTIDQSMGKPRNDSSPSQKLDTRSGSCRAPVNVNCTNSCFRLVIHTNDRPTIYQRGITPSELASACGPHALAGNIVLIVLKPVHLSHLEVEFSGCKLETCLEIAPQSSKLSGGYKKSHFNKILHEGFVWRLQDHSLHDHPLPPGVYTFPFNFLVDPSLPPSIASPNLSVNYTLAASLHYSAAPNTNKPRQPKLAKSKINVPIVRCLSDNSTALLTDPIMASGNWRDIMVYEFGFQRKVAFQHSLHGCCINIYPIDTSSLFFNVHLMSIVLIQQCHFEKVRPGDSHTPISNNDNKHTEVQKFLLCRKMVSFKDFTMTPAGSLHLETTFRVPTHHYVYDKYNYKEKKTVYPTIISENHRGFTVSHTLKIGLEVSEHPCPKSISPNQTSSNYTSLASSQSSEPFSPKAGEVNTSPEEEDTLGTSHLNSSQMPSYSTYHPRKGSASRFRKAELSFAAPIIVLSPQSSQSSEAPPLYSHANDTDSVDFNDCWQHLIPSDKFKDKTSGSIVPPSYSEP